MVKLAIALFVFEAGTVVGALALATFLVRWTDEMRERSRFSPIRKMNLSWQSSRTPPNPGI